MIKSISLSLLFVCTLHSLLCSQDVQWANRVIEFSTEYADKQYAAKQALGEPDVLPAFKTSPCAWSPSKEENRSGEWLMVGFKYPSVVQQIAIGETFNAGTITKVTLYDVNEVEHVVYEERNPGPVSSGGRLLRISMAPTNYRVVALRVDMETMAVAGYNHIDAIGISNSDVPIEPRVNIIPNLVFDSKPVNLGTAVNSKYDEIMPVISPDGKALYFDRKDHPANTSADINDDIWIARADAAGNWTKAINVGKPLNTPGHNFLTSITPDGNLALLGNVYNADGSMSAGISIAYMTKNGWSAPEKVVIKNYYNKSKYSEYQLASNGRAILMAIERDDSEGSKDLYVSFVLADGTWSEPKHLGPVVNSAATEMSPFLAADNKTLYFSSAGHSGYGKNDMFITRRLDNSWTNWSKPQNLGPKINTNEWEAYYTVPASGEYAYFSSEKNSIGKTDIYRIKLPKELRPDAVSLVAGVVNDMESGAGIPAEVVYMDATTKEVIGVARSAPKTGEYKVALPAGSSYTVLAKCKGYFWASIDYDLKSDLKYKELKKDFALVAIEDGLTFILENVKFTPSSSNLKAASYRELDLVVEMLEENPGVSIEIGGHTDNTCADSFCLKISNDRAEGVKEYLISKGIDASRLSSMGYGSTKPAFDNTTIEGRTKNQRVDISVKLN